MPTKTGRGKILFPHINSKVRFLILDAFTSYESVHFELGKWSQIPCLINAQDHFFTAH